MGSPVRASLLVRQPPRVGRTTTEPGAWQRDKKPAYDRLNGGGHSSSWGRSATLLPGSSFAMFHADYRHVVRAAVTARPSGPTRSAVPRRPVASERTARSV